MDKRMTVNVLNNWKNWAFLHFFSRVLHQNPIENICDHLFLFIILVIISSVQKREIYGIELRTTVWYLPVSCCQGAKAARNINKSYIFNIVLTFVRRSSCLPSPCIFPYHILWYKIWLTDFSISLHEMSYASPD